MTKPFHTLYMRLSFLLFTTFCLFIASCRKDPIIPISASPCDTTYHRTYTLDTIHPSEYLMAYPGSWWEYDNGNKVECVEWDYMPVYEQSKNENGCPFIESNYAYYPRLIGASNKYISGNSALNINQHPYNTTTTPIILEHGEIQHYSGNSTTDYYTTVTKQIHETFDSIEINGTLFYDVINIRTQYKRSYHELAGGGPTDATHAYYAKGVGLLQLVSYINSDGTGEEEGEIHKSITDFFIAPH